MSTTRAASASTPKITESRKSLASMTTEEKFHAAVNVIKSLPKNGNFQPSDDLKLKFYGYFKQATEGPNETPKPPFYDLVNRYKWDAWKKLSSMSKEDAMNGYVEELKKIVETMSYNEEISKFYEVLGPFYEVAVNDSPKKYPGKMNGDISHGDGIPPTNGNNLYPEEHLINNTNYDYNDKGCPPTNGLATNGGLSESIESDGEEFSDTFDHIGNANTSVTELRNGVPDDIISARGEVDVSSVRLHNSSLPSRPSSSRTVSNRGAPQTLETGSNAPSGTGGDGSGGSGPYNRDLNSEVNEQIALAILRLQQSVDQISHRLTGIEGRMNQTEHSMASRKSGSANNWWPFSICPKTMAFVVAWPFIVHYLMTALKNRRPNK